MAVTRENIKQKTISSLFWKFLEQGGYAAIGLVVQVVMSWLLDPAEFGVLAIMLVFVNVGNVIVQSGLNTAIIQDPDVTDRDYDTVFWMSLALSLVLYLTVFLTAPLIAAFYDMPTLVAPLRTITLVLVVNAYFSIQEAIVARQMQFQKTFRATVISALVSGAVGIGVALAGGGLWALVAQQLCIQTVKCIVLAAQVSWKPRLIFERHRAVVLFRFGWKLLASGMLDQLYQSLSDLIIGKVFTKSELGFVSQGKKYPQALGVTLDGAIQPVMLSTVSRVRERIDDVKRVARRGLKTSSFLIVPSMCAFALVADSLVPLLLGEKWAASVPFLRAYCIIYALLPIHTTNLQVLNGMGRSDLFLRLEMINKVIGLSALLFCAFGLRDLYAIVYGKVFVDIAAVFVNAHPNKRVIGYSYREQIADVLPAWMLAAVSAAAAAPLATLGLGSGLTVLVQCLVFSVVYLALAAILRIEAFTYLLTTARNVIARRRA